METYLFEAIKLGDAMTTLVAEAFDLNQTNITNSFNKSPRSKVSLFKNP